MSKLTTRTTFALIPQENVHNLVFAIPLPVPPGATVVFGGGPPDAFGVAASFGVGDEGFDAMDPASAWGPLAPLMSRKRSTMIRSFLLVLGTSLLVCFC